MTRFDITTALKSALERTVWTFEVRFEGHGEAARVSSRLLQVHEQRRPSTRHRNWESVRRVRHIRTDEGRSMGPRVEWYRWADVTKAMGDDFRWHGGFHTVEPPTVPPAIASELARRLTPTISVPENQPKPEAP